MILVDRMEERALHLPEREQLGGGMWAELPALGDLGWGPEGRAGVTSVSCSGIWVYRPLLMYLPSSSLFIFTFIYPMGPLVTLRSNHDIEATYLKTVPIILIL